MALKVTTADDRTPGFHIFRGDSPEGLETGDYFWHVVAKNGEIECVSEAYTTAQHAAEGIQAVTRTVLEAVITEIDKSRHE
jgi:uncharacterized protein YegP (UPF0339 family)